MMPPNQKKQSLLVLLLLGACQASLMSLAAQDRGESGANPPPKAKRETPHESPPAARPKNSGPVVDSQPGKASHELTTARQGKSKKPNIIVIFTDDQGYADLGCQSVLDDLRTPNIDKLAADGIRFTQGYVTAPQCIPSRAGILTSRYQQRFGLDANGSIPLPINEATIPERLQNAGYRTGMVGKWHLDPNHASKEWIREFMPEAKQGRIVIPAELSRRYMPDQRGFSDIFCGQIQSYLENYDLDGTDIKPARKLLKSGFRIDIQTEAALAFIERSKAQPFFLYLAYFAPHVPLEATEKYLDRFPGDMPERRRTALAMISAMDDGVGRIRRSLEQHGLTDNTLVFFISDNGAPLKLDMKDLPISDKKGAWDGSRNDPWIGEKGMLTEGGIRVPFIMSWPGTLPAGKSYNHPVITLDVGATAIELAGLEKVSSMDGVNLIPHLTGKTANPPHEMLFWRFWSQSAVRKGKWKYFQAGERKYLFDLSSPQHEKINLIAKHPEIAAQLQTSLKQWADSLKKPGLSRDRLAGRERASINYYLPR